MSADMIRMHYYDYKCEKCGWLFSITSAEYILSMHTFGAKYVKCPNCGKRSLAKPIPKNSND